MEKLWNVKETASLLGLTVKSLYALAERRGIPVQRIGRRLMFNPPEIQRWLQQQARRELSVGGRRRRERRAARARSGR